MDLERERVGGQPPVNGNEGCSAPPSFDAGVDDPSVVVVEASEQNDSRSQNNSPLENAGLPFLDEDEDSSDSPEHEKMPKPVVAVLPTDFMHEIVNYTPLEEGFNVRLRVNIRNDIEFDRWLSEFEWKSKTHYVVRHTWPWSVFYTCNRRLVCQHASFRKQSNRRSRANAKNTACKAQLRVRIKGERPAVCKHDKFALMGLFGVIDLKFVHNHELSSADSLSALPLRKEVKAQLVKLFESGLMPAAALNAYLETVDDKEAEDNPFNTSIWPTLKQVNNMFQPWRRQLMDHSEGSPLWKVLFAKAETLSKKGFKIAVSKSPFAVAVITPLMLRLQESRYMEDVAFLETSDGIDSSSIGLIFLLVGTPAGAYPVAMFMMDRRDQESFTVGLKRVFEISTGKFRQGPAEMITENLPEYRDALRKMWPKTAFRLCQLQAQRTVDQWLKNPENKIAVEHQQELLEIFAGLIQCRTISEAENAYREIRASRSLRAAYGNFLRYLNGFWKRREEYCFAWRTARNRGHTCKSSDVMVKALKEKVLRGRRCYNVVHLLDRITCRMEKYLQRRMMLFLSNPFPNTSHQGHLRRIGYIKGNEYIVKINDVTFKVPSSVEPERPKYTVRMDIGSCECSEGMHGTLCKHQFAVWQMHGVHPSTAQAIIAIEDRQWFTNIVLGDETASVVRSTGPRQPRHVNAWRHKIRFRDSSGEQEADVPQRRRRRIPPPPEISPGLAACFAEIEVDSDGPPTIVKMQSIEPQMTTSA